MKQIFLILVLLFSSTPAYGCNKVSSKCIEGPSTRLIGGKPVQRECWKYEDKYDCVDAEYKDYCQVIRQVPGCEQIDSKCVAQDESGKCLEYRDTFRCGNLLSNQPAETKLLDSEYTITRDELNTKECESYDNPDCQELESVCVEGAETRNINGKSIYKDCWKYSKKYACFVGSIISECKEYEGKCALVATNCISKSKDGKCTHTEKKYECAKLTGTTPVSLNCRTAQYCIGDNCEQTTYIPNNNMGKAISGLAILGTLRGDMIEEECANGAANCKVFSGGGHSCRVNPVGSRNCCKDRGWANDLKLTDCKESEKVLGKKKEKGLCHEVGKSYCARQIAGICLEKKQGYCCFNSKLARIIHEQGRAQLGISWGTSKNPNCHPLTIEQLQKINFDKIDLSELYAELTSKINLSMHIGIGEAAKSSVQKKSLETSQYTSEIARRISEYYSQ